MTSPPPRTRLLGLLQLLRPRQWIKNGFVLAPLIFTGTFLNRDAVAHALVAVGLFCLASSTTYIVNDLLDIEHDRKHPGKSRTRPLAAGLVSVPQALLLLGLLYLLLIASWPAAPQTMQAVAAFLVLNLAYTFYLKHQPVLDIFTIASGFVLRVWGGAQALHVPVSVWMFVTTLCLALYLAALKRRQELLQSGTDARAVLQKYSVQLVDRYAEMAATGALLSYSMFVMSVRPQLTVSIPLVLFGLFRYWYVVDALDGGESPTDALLADRPLLLAVLAWVAVCMWTLAGVKE